ncbi:MAG: regulatory protein TetR [Thermoleophilia bacterium]|nr:regulatory protein TetR [Thermoleophilia bacterium]
MATTPTSSSTSASGPRSTAAERREHLLEVAMHEFAKLGYEGGSTERIAKAAGISQPYVFRLFGSKLQLFLAVIERCYAETLTMFQEAAEGHEGRAALDAIGESYTEMIVSRPERLQCQMVGYASCDHAEVRAAMRRGFGRLVTFAERASGLGPDEVAAFFAKGMLLNVLTSMRLPHEPMEWSDRLILGCMAKAEDTGG